jgi:flavin reductase (DIM6/NTAB) family NADH-FMN oxidoreductase RutF
VALAVDRDTLRHALSLFATGVTVVSVAVPDDQPRGMTANAFMSGSLAPPLVVVSIAHRARLHAALSARGRFGVSILPEALEREGRRFAGMPVAPDVPAPEFTVHAGVPVLTNSLACLVNQTVDTHVVGDHTLFVGEVQAVLLGDVEEPPLGYHRSRFARVSRLDDAPGGLLDPWLGSAVWG